MTSLRVKNKNIDSKTFIEKVERKVFFKWLENNNNEVDFVFHLGARTDTTEFNMSVFDELNLNYSKSVWECCTKYNIPLVYASSAATYGMGELGYDDNINLIDKLKPLNPYAISKNEFDKWVIKQEKHPPFWAGLKFFNVYGPNEYHKGRMASVVFHAYKQIKETGKVRLFRSHNPEYEDGKQLRDFIYVKDIVNICVHFLKISQIDRLSDYQINMKNMKILQSFNQCIFNAGTGKARTFIDLAKATFAAMNLPENIEFIDTPIDIRDKYQYFTEAKTERLCSAGYDIPFYNLEEGINDYVVSYLTQNLYY